MTPVIIERNENNDKRYFMLEKITYLFIFIFIFLTYFFYIVENENDTSVDNSSQNLMSIYYDISRSYQQQVTTKRSTAMSIFQDDLLEATDHRV